MKNLEPMGRLLLFVGILIILLGGIIYFFGSYFRWLGNLPGDFRVEGENYTIYIPLATMLIISLSINILWRILRFFF